MISLRINYILQTPTNHTKLLKCIYANDMGAFNLAIFVITIFLNSWTFKAFGGWVAKWGNVDVALREKLAWLPHLGYSIQGAHFEMLIP